MLKPVSPAAEKRGMAQVLGTVKNALVVWMGILFLADVVTPLQARPGSDNGFRVQKTTTKTLKP